MKEVNVDEFKELLAGSKQEELQESLAALAAGQGAARNSFMDQFIRDLKKRRCS